MLIFQVLDRKRLLTRPDGVEVLDLTERTWDPRGLNLRLQGYVTIDERYEGRPDLVAYDHLGSDALTDLLLKYNGFSNPLAVAQGMVLALPDAQEARRGLSSANRDRRKDIRETRLDPSKLTEKDQARLAYLARKAAERGLTASQAGLSPNLAPTGSQAITLQDGAFSFGAQRVDTACGSLSRAQYQEKMLRKRLQGQDPTTPDTVS